MADSSTVEGAVTAPTGYLACGIAAGIKADGLDLALLVSEADATVAGTFTTNKVQAAPVLLCKECVAHGSARAILVNSGCANACTGAAGMVDARQMAVLTADAVGVDVDGVLVCSTGTIGTRIPMAKIESGVPAAANALSRAGGDAAAKAIMTTDTVDKQVAVELEIDGGSVCIGGMAKGSGMIDPNMATMLAFITTDADVDRASLQECLSLAVKASFNAITVDGDQSTNDTVLMLANGASGAPRLDRTHPSWGKFCDAVQAVCSELALKIVKDGEGATKLVTVTVGGAESDQDAKLAASAVANSLLCKTAWFGGDPNWGRVIAAVGYSGAAVDPTKVDIAFDDLVAVRNGQMVDEVTLAELEAVYAKESFSIGVNLNLGDGVDTVYTCDCSYDYVKINAEYMT